jgi:enamine deaminase RidA (YjgF/YER057c/UK114 family)
MSQKVKVDFGEVTRHIIVPLNEYEKHFVTLDLRPFTDPGDLREVYRERVRQLADEGVSVVYEKVFGALSSRPDFTSMRSAAYQEFGRPAPPMTYVEGLPVPSGLLSGVVIYGIKSAGDSPVEIRYLGDARNGSPRASLVVTARERALHLCEVIGREAPGRSRFTQFLEALDQAREFIVGQGFTSGDIVRTWFYLTEIERDYQQFNDARREFFTQNGIAFTADANELPASTGIQGRSAEGGLVAADVFCIDKAASRCSFRRISSNLQSEPDGRTYQYKSTFSRGMLVSDEEHEMLHVSGTASINEVGATLHPGDPAEQIRLSLKVVTTLLRQNGFDIEDLCQVTYFFKDEEVYRHFEELRRELGYRDITGPCVIADVCRDDLLFEIDGIALKRLHS